MRIRSLKYQISLVVCNILIFTSIAIADIRSNLEYLRDKCLYFAIGYAPNDGNTKTIIHGLYAQSPFSPVGQIDIAASGFSLAALPLAVKHGLISRTDAYQIALAAGARIRELVENSEAALTSEQISNFGYRGMLYHYYTWSDMDNLFHRSPSAEVSSIDTTLLMLGFLVSAQYFQGQVMTDYHATVNLINWSEWVDLSKNQFWMSYSPESGFVGHWDVYSHETMLICIFAAMSDPSLRTTTIWDAWHKELATYTSPAPDSKTFTCYATWFGDPFTVFYGLSFFKFGQDCSGIDWFSHSRTAYLGHVEFFKKERNYLDNMVFAFSDGTQNAVIAKPKLSPDVPIVRTDAPVYGIAGGLEFYSKDPQFNEIAITLSSLVESNNNFFQWHGWPCESVTATDINHSCYNNYIIGQNISAIAIFIDNYLSGGIRDLVMENPEMEGIMNFFFPPKTWIGPGTDWNTDDNWDPMGVPTSTDNVLIPSGVSQPVISSYAVCNKLTIDAGASLIINLNLTIY